MSRNSVAKTSGAAVKTGANTTAGGPSKRSPQGPPGPNSSSHHHRHLQPSGILSADDVFPPSSQMNQNEMLCNINNVVNLPNNSSKDMNLVGPLGGGASGGGPSRSPADYLATASDVSESFSQRQRAEVPASKLLNLAELQVQPGQSPYYFEFLFLLCDLNSLIAKPFCCSIT